jgi:serine phosphatase RsbU (regulator of sigma subunit)
VCRLKPESLLVLFTDGVIDQTDNSGHDYTEQRLWGLLKMHGGLTPQQLSGKLAVDLASFRGDAPQRDDITFVIMKYGEQPADPASRRGEENKHGQLSENATIVRRVRQ